MEAGVSGDGRQGKASELIGARLCGSKCGFHTSIRVMLHGWGLPAGRTASPRRERGVGAVGLLFRYVLERCRHAGRWFVHRHILRQCLLFAWSATAYVDRSQRSVSFIRLYFRTRYNRRCRHSCLQMHTLSYIHVSTFEILRRHNILRLTKSTGAS